MDLHQNNFCRNLLQNLIDLQEGIVRAVVHIAPADQIHHCHVTGPGFKNLPPPAGNLGGIVGRPDDLRAILHVVHDLPFGPGMVAHGNTVRTGIQNVLRLVGSDAHNGSIFSVDHHEIRTGLPLHLTQMAAHPLQSGAAHHIAYRQYLKFHSHSLQAIL